MSLYFSINFSLLVLHFLVKSNNNGVAEEKVSPPPSDFLMEEAVIGPALDRYSTLRKSMENLTDNEIIDLEEEEEEQKGIIN